MSSAELFDQKLPGRFLLGTSQCAIHSIQKAHAQVPKLSLHVSGHCVQEQVEKHRCIDITLLETCTHSKPSLLSCVVAHNSALSPGMQEPIGPQQIVQNTADDELI